MRTYLIIVALFTNTLAVAAAVDVPGASDPVGLPRVSGAQIIGARSSDYDLGIFMRAADGKKLEVTTAEGAYHRVLYLLPDGASSVAAQKNYQTALADLGVVEEVYRCVLDCNEHALSSALWTRDNLVDTPDYPKSLYLLGFRHVYSKGAYRYVRVKTERALLNIGVFSGTLTDKNVNKNISGRTLVVLDVVVEEAFEADLEFVDADKMIAQINDLGAIALYGIQFDTGKATLKAESDPTLAEITRALTASPQLSLYVVGHTDDSGALAYNQELSRRRADTVVAALQAAGVTAERLTALGVGPVAPKASNDTPAGRTLNRRVELVKRGLD